MLPLLNEIAKPDNGPKGNFLLGVFTKLLSHNTKKQHGRYYMSSWYEWNECNN